MLLTVKRSDFIKTKDHSILRFCLLFTVCNLLLLCNYVPMVVLLYNLYCTDFEGRNLLNVLRFDFDHFIITIYGKRNDIFKFRNKHNHVYHLLMCNVLSYYVVFKYGDGYSSLAVIV